MAPMPLELGADALLTQLIRDFVVNELRAQRHNFNVGSPGLPNLTLCQGLVAVQVHSS